MASTGGSLQCDEIAKIIPRSHEAENALDLVYDHKALSKYHRSFLHVERRPRPPDSDGETDEVSSSNHQPSIKSQYWAGCYVLALQDPVKAKTSIGWRLGKGDLAYGDDLGVDIVLIRPGTGSGSRQTAPVHARIRFHARSGVLMIFGVENDRPVLYKTHDAHAPLSLGQGEGHVLYQPSNTFYVGKLHYDIVFREFGSDDYSTFVEKRNAVLYGPGTAVPHHAISAVPRPEDVKRGTVITHGMLGYGGFGRVFPAVQARTGEPLAVKQHLPTKKSQLKVIALEADIGASFKASDGLLPTLGYWCEHDYSNPCDKVPQAVFTSSPLAIWDFAQVAWIKCSTSDVLELFRGPLQGLVHLHARGYMHRDVTLKNMFVLSLNPARAVLGDFGKALRAKTDRDASIGPAATRAPEVDGKTPYSNKIDVWSMGWALIWVLGSDLIPPGPWHDLPLHFDAWYKSVMGLLTFTREQGSRISWIAKLAELIIGMLALDPAERISAAEALRQVAALLASSPPQEASPPVPCQQILVSKPSPPPSALSQRDAQIEPGGHPFTFEKQVQEEPVGVTGKKARLQ
ncbi:MAG: hypothetical protein Q9184_004044 [Pyrenodesmia sp. 2 TL-2023]